MTLPDRDDSPTVPREYVDHIVAREVMKHRLNDVESRQLLHEDRLTKFATTIQAGIDAINEKLSKGREEFRQDIDDCRKEFREEMHEELKSKYATQMELQVLEGKVDRMWAKITAAVAVAMVALQMIFKLIGWA